MIHYMSFSDSGKEYGPFDDHEKADMDRTAQVPIQWRTEHWEDYVERDTLFTTNLEVDKK